MKKVLLSVAFVMAFSQLSWAAGVPRCWIADQPGQDIQDGKFVVVIPTMDHEALAVAQALGIVSQAPVSQMGVATSDTLDRIVIEVFGDLQYWEPTAAFPTVDVFKTYIVESLEPVLGIPGASVQCLPVEHHQPVH